MSFEELLDDQIDEITDDTNVGKWMIFVVPNHPAETMFNFSSDIDQIGIDWDCQLQNHTKVWVVSEPTTIYREQYGKSLTVSRIVAHEAMWVQTANLVHMN
jgi:hypothetical protein